MCDNPAKIAQKKQQKKEQEAIEIQENFRFKKQQFDTFIEKEQKALEASKGNQQSDS